MNILFDLITPQSFIGGAGEYIRRVFYALLDNINSDTQILVAVDTNIGNFAYRDLSIESLKQKNIQYVDLGKSNLVDVIRTYHVDKVFIGAAQYWGNRYQVEKITCPVICVVHDLQDEECGINGIHCLTKIQNLNWFAFLKYWIKDYPRQDWNKRMSHIIKLHQKNHNAIFVTVSEYSKHSLLYNYGIRDRIIVLYSPARLVEEALHFENTNLKTIIEEKKKYYLLLGGNRPLKNSHRVIKAFEVFMQNDKSCAYLVTVGMGKSLCERHISLPYLSAGDLNLAYKNCYAMLFPSMFEGFGYPPIEAMQYGKPILASNVTSIPEICKDAAIYFSPFYVSDIYRALCVLNDANYAEFSQKSLSRYAEISERQNQDLKSLINMIMEHCM